MKRSLSVVLAALIAVLTLAPALDAAPKKAKSLYLHLDTRKMRAKPPSSAFYVRYALQKSGKYRPVGTVQGGSDATLCAKSKDVMGLWRPYRIIVIQAKEEWPVPYLEGCRAADGGFQPSSRTIKWK